MWTGEAFGANVAMPVLFDASRRVRTRDRMQKIRQWEWFSFQWWGWHKSCLDFMLKRCSELQLLTHIEAVNRAKKSRRAAWVYESPLIRFAKNVPEGDLIDAIVESRS
mgnify:FL=1|jgi:hypothetical protein